MQSRALRVAVVAVLVGVPMLSVAAMTSGCRRGGVGSIARAYSREERRQRMREQMIEYERLEVVTISAVQNEALEKSRADFYRLCDRYGETQATLDLGVFARLMQSRDRDPEVMTRPSDEKLASALWASFRDTLMGHSNLRWVTVKGYESDPEAVFLADQTADTLINPGHYVELWMEAKKVEGVRDTLAEIDKACKRTKSKKPVEQVFFPPLEG